MMDRQILRQAFARVLREARTAQGLSQEDLAIRTGFHRTYISQLERGIKSPTLDTLVRLGEVLQIRASDLVLGVEYVQRKSSKRIVA